MDPRHHEAPVHPALRSLRTRPETRDSTPPDDTPISTSDRDGARREIFAIDRRTVFIGRRFFIVRIYSTIFYINYDNRVQFTFNPLYVRFGIFRARCTSNASKHSLSLAVFPACYVNNNNMCYVTRIFD